MTSTEKLPKRLFFLIRVKDGASHDDFEEFVASQVLPRIRQVESVISYQAYRIEGYTFDDERRDTLPCDYIDVVEVTDVARYATDVKALLDGDWGKSFAQEWGRYVLEDFPIYGTSLDADTSV